MSKSIEAKETFEKGFNCAQSVLFSHGNQFFREKESALKLASGFGAGISYRGEMCGAVSAALMVIGLHYGYSDPAADTSREMTLKITGEFLETFEKQNGSVTCSRLLNTEINTNEGLDYARQNGLFKKICPKLVESASDILETLMEKYPAKTVTK